VEKGINTPLSALSERARAPDGRTDAFCLLSVISAQMLPEGQTDTRAIGRVRGGTGLLPATLTFDFTLWQESQMLFVT